MDLEACKQAAYALFRKHKLTGWTFGFRNTGRRLGVCKWRGYRIELQTYYAQHNPESEVMETVLHEIAHALAGPKHGHDAVWQSIAREIGCKDIKAKATGAEIITKPGKYQARCKNCDKTYNLHRKPNAGSRYHCVRCGKIDGALTFVDTTAVPPPPKASGGSLFDSL